MNTEYFEIDDMPDIRGLRFRGYRGEEDVPFFHAISRRQNEFLDLDLVETLDDTLLYYRNLYNCDVSKDILITEIDDVMIGYSRVFWTRKIKSGYNYLVIIYLEPEYYGKGIRAVLLEWCEKRLREIAKQHPDSETKEFETWSMDNEDDWIGLLNSNGYRKVRYGYIMKRSLIGDIPTAKQHPLPEGLELRPALPEHYRRIWEADVEASKDGWEMVEHPEERYKFFIENHEFQPEKMQVAWDTETDEIAGAVMPFINDEENKVYDRKRGYTEFIHVGRKWRGKGLAKSLIASSFELLKELGMEETALGVDAENPTGALRLYTAMGFEVDKTFYTYRKEL